MSYVKIVYIKDLLAIFVEPLLFIISALIVLPIVLSISAVRANRIRSPFMRNVSKQLDRTILIFAFIVLESGFISLLAGKIFYRPITLTETLNEKKAYQCKRLGGWDTCYQLKTKSYSFAAESKPYELMAEGQCYQFKFYTHNYFFITHAPELVRIAELPTKDCRY